MKQLFVVGTRVRTPSLPGSLYFAGPGRRLTFNIQDAVPILEEEIDQALELAKEVSVFDFVPFIKPL